MIESDFECAECGAEFGSVRGLQGHAKAHPGESVLRSERLLSNLNEFAERIDETPAANQMEDDGPHSSKVYENRFGSWNDALRAAGLTPKRHREVERGELLDEINRLEEELGRPPTIFDIREQGKFGEKPYNRVFGSLADARREAGYPLYVPFWTSCEQCGKEFRKGRARGQEASNHFCSQNCYDNWKGEAGEDHPLSNAAEVACDACGEVLLRKQCWADNGERNFCDRECMGDFRSNQTGEDSFAWKGGYEPYYGPNWNRQRRKARERDGRTCQACGVGEDDLDRELSVHHITPFRQFIPEEGEPDYEAANALDNLVSLCRDCHREWEGIPLRPA